MAALLNQGSVPYGSRLIDGMVADNISVSIPTKVIERTDELDEPSGQVIYAGVATGTATLQMASANDVPTLGATFTSTFGAITSWVITGIDIPEDKGADQKVNISFRQSLA
jgi:hypothetical protein